VTIVSFGGGFGRGTNEHHPFGGGGGPDGLVEGGGGLRLMLISLSLSDDIHGE
jgi:hypothetical protein